jgi:hypothetical protein
MRAFLLVLAALVLVVPTVQLMSAVTSSFVHQVSAKTSAKTSTGSRIPAVVARPLLMERSAVASRVISVEPHDLGLGFPTAPFVPPRG